MKPEIATAVRALFAQGDDVDDSTKIAAHAAEVCMQVSRHLARLVGTLGMRAMFERSFYLAGASFACLRMTPVDPDDDPYEALRNCLQQEAPDVAREASTHVFTTFIELLERFIGERLVASLLHEVWPAIFPAVVKETQ